MLKCSYLALSAQFFILRVTGRCLLFHHSICHSFSKTLRIYVRYLVI